MSNFKLFDDEFLNEVRRVCIQATPKDTGNLAYNALAVHRINNGFRVTYRSQVAGYGKILNDSFVLRGFLNGKPNPHYLWFDSGVHMNVLRSVIKKFGGKQKVRRNTIILPTERTFEGQAQYTHRVTNDGSVEQTTSNAALRQINTLKEWNSRYEQYKNNRKQGWGI